jgi:hypothetical protein
MVLPARRESLASEVDELGNFEYFKFDQQHQLDDVIAKVKAKENKKEKISATNLYNSFSTFLNKKMQGSQFVDQGKLEAQRKLEILPPGKKLTPEWTEITASCAFSDFLILGFGNGAMAMLKVSHSKKVENKIHHLDLAFSGDEDLPIDKMEVITMDLLPVSKEDHSKPMSILLSLSGGIINCHSLPDLEKLEFLQIDEIVDF